MGEVIEKWKINLGLTNWTIATERIEKAQVTYDVTVPIEEKYFVGISANKNDGTAIIFHDRDLLEIDIVHELLHLAYPSKEEEEIIELTDKIMSNDTSSNTYIDTGTVCTKCSGYIIAPITWNSTASPTMCNCVIEPQPAMMQGWVCPVCGSGMSPFASKCDCNFKGYVATCNCSCQQAIG